MIKKQKKNNFVCHLMTLWTLLWGMPPPRSDILGKTTYIKTPQTTFNASIWWKRLVATYIDAELNFLADFHTELALLFLRILAPFFHTDFGAISCTELGGIFPLTLAPFFSIWIWRQNRNWDLASQNAYLMMKSLLLLASTTWIGGRFFPCSRGWVSANKNKTFWYEE